MKDRIKRELERVLGISPKTPADFERLRELIFQRVRVYVSSTTLKRLWGYLREDVSHRLSTYNILSRVLGYADWEDFKAHADEEGAIESNPVVGEKIDVAKDLKKGDRLVIYWNPGRVCHLEYLGEFQFRVMDSEKTRFQAGDTFTCRLLIE